MATNSSSGTYWDGAVSKLSNVDALWELSEKIVAKYEASKS